MVCCQSDRVASAAASTHKRAGRPPAPRTSGPCKSPASAPLAAPRAELCQTYVVQSGDSLWSIASQFGTQQDDLVAALEQCIGYTAGTALQIGQKICLPGYIPACDNVIDSGQCCW